MWQELIIFYDFFRLRNDSAIESDKSENNNEVKDANGDTDDNNGNYINDWNNIFKIKVVEISRNQKKTRPANILSLKKTYKGKQKAVLQIIFMPHI